ncbi:MAG: hypothetical protein NC900_03725, partial [Candidatus Omnitrophica bacterium]|nr:hypothetical protein [Candidatus Omnitrophota bacterium]
MDYLEQIHKRFFIILASVILFLGFIFYYNFYLIDYSLANLEVMRVKIESIKSLKDIATLKDNFKKIILYELSEPKLDYRCILDLDFAYSILNSIQDKRQLKDIKFFIEDAIKIKSSKKDRIVYFLDRVLNKLFGSYYRETPLYKLKFQEINLFKKIQSTKDKFTLQRLYFELADLYIKLNDY